jgi:hypothetical protein
MQIECEFRPKTARIRREAAMNSTSGNATMKKPEQAQA